jgi:hypothetical protein
VEERTRGRNLFHAKSSWGAWEEKLVALTTTKSSTQHEH